MTAVYVLAIVVLFLVVLFLFAAIKVAREYERGIVFRLGRLLPQPKGPGLFLLIPVVDRMVKVDLRTITLNIPPQEVITKDNVPVRVNAVRTSDRGRRTHRGRELQNATFGKTTPAQCSASTCSTSCLRAGEDQRDPARESHDAIAGRSLRRGEGCRSSGHGRRWPARPGRASVAKIISARASSGRRSA